MMQYKKWFILLLIPIAVLIVPHISLADILVYSSSTYDTGNLHTLGQTITLPTLIVSSGTTLTYTFGNMSLGNNGQSGYFPDVSGNIYGNAVISLAGIQSTSTYSFSYISDGTSPDIMTIYGSTGLYGIETFSFELYGGLTITANTSANINITNPNPSSTVYSDFPSWGFTATGLTSSTNYIYEILYDTAPIPSYIGGNGCYQSNTGVNGLVGYLDASNFTATTSTQNLTLNKSGALVRSDLSQFTNYINLNGYPTTLYTETCLLDGSGILQDTTSTINLAIGGVPINASSTNITIVSPSSTSTPVAPFENYIYGVIGVATDTQYTVNQTVTQFINGIPIAPYTQTQSIIGSDIIANGLTFQNRNELDNYGNATSVPMAVGVTISNGIGEIGQLEYNYTMLPFQSVGTNASSGLEQIVNPNGTSTLINNIATGNGSASSTIPYSGKGLSSVCFTPSNILEFGEDADYISCKLNNFINQLTFNATQNITDAINGTYNTFTGIFPIDVFADFNNDISIAQAYSNSTSSTPLVLKGQSIADATTGLPTGQYTFGGLTMPVLTSSTTSWIQTKSGFNYRGVIDNILYALTGLIMLGGAIGVVVMIHKTTSGNA